MGKTTTALVIWVDPAYIDLPQVKRLTEMGHEVVNWEDLRYSGTPDLILSPVAHWWPPEFWVTPAYLDQAVKRAKARKKGFSQDASD